MRSLGLGDQRVAHHYSRDSIFVMTHLFRTEIPKCDKDFRWKLELELQPRKLTWNLKMSPWKRRFLLKTIIFRFHVSFRGCTHMTQRLHNHHPWSSPRGKNNASSLKRRQTKPIAMGCHEMYSRLFLQGLGYHFARFCSWAENFAPVKLNPWIFSAIYRGLVSSPPFITMGFWGPPRKTSSASTSRLHLPKKKCPKISGFNRGLFSHRFI